MSSQFQCPSCSGALFYETGDETFQTCHHCGGQIIVPSTVIHQQEVLDTKPTERALEDQRNFVLAEITSELNAGRKIHAIKMFRDSFGADLATAKNAVEMMEQNSRIPKAALTQVSPAAPIEQKIHGTATTVEPAKVRSAAIILWMIISIGIAIAVIFFTGDG